MHTSPQRGHDSTTHTISLSDLYGRDIPTVLRQDQTFYVGTMTPMRLVPHLPQVVPPATTRLLTDGANHSTSKTLPQIGDGENLDPE